MATYYVSSVDGSDSDNGTTWALAKATLAGAIAVATTNGDIIKVSHLHTEELGADTTYIAGANIEIWSVDRASSDAPTAQGTSYWIGNSTTNRSVTIESASDGTLFIYGLTIRTAGSTADSIIIGSNGDIRVDNCYLWQGNTATTSGIALGSATTTHESYVTVTNSTLRFGNTAQRIICRNAGITIENCTVSSDGSAITAAFQGTASSGGPLIAIGCDFSFVNNTLVDDPSAGYRSVTIVRCKLPASWTPIAASTASGKSGCELFLQDCHSGDEHIHIGHANPLGSTICDTGIYATDNIADSNLSWKIVGSSAATPNMPYESPWLDVYHAGTSAITPYLECVRSGSSTAYNNNEVWSQWSYKGTSGSTKSSIVGDGMALGGTPAAQTTSSKGASDWSGENATSWFGKLNPVSAITPAEVGHIRARVCVAGANTVYVDPQIRGLA